MRSTGCNTTKEIKIKAKVEKNKNEKKTDE
jgi:hypothetical protein